MVRNESIIIRELMGILPFCRHRRHGRPRHCQPSKGKKEKIDEADPTSMMVLSILYNIPKLCDKLASEY